MKLELRYAIVRVLIQLSLIVNAAMITKSYYNSAYVVPSSARTVGNQKADVIDLIKCLNSRYKLKRISSTLFKNSKGRYRDKLIKLE